MAIIMSRKQSMLLGLGLLALFFIVSAVIIAAKNSATISLGSVANTLETDQNTQGGLGFTLDNFHRSLIRDGKKIWEIRGTSGNYQVKANSATIINPDLTINRPTGESATITAKKATLTLEGTQLKNADLTGDVLVRYQSQTTLSTSRAIFDYEADQITIPNEFTIKNPLFSIKARTLQGTLANQEFIASGGVTSTIKPQEK